MIKNNLFKNLIFFIVIFFGINDSLGQEIAIIYMLPPFDNKIYPNSEISNAFSSNKIIIRGCRGEYEPSTFALKSNIEINDLRFEIEGFEGEREKFSSENLNIRAVKCWYQSGNSINKSNDRVFTPELLLHNDSLIVTDNNTKNNYLKSKNNYINISNTNSDDLVNIEPSDEKIISPVKMNSNELKQFWVNIHIPSKISSGTYKGKIKITINNNYFKYIDVNIEVLPFDLVKSNILYGIYYRGKLIDNNNDKDKIYTETRLGKYNSEYKTYDQYVKEMINLRDHGILYPTIYQSDISIIEKELNIRKELGLPFDKVFFVGFQTAITKDFDYEKFIIKINKLKKLLEKYAVSEWYIYGKDEAGQDDLIQQAPLWEKIHNNEGRIFASIDKNNAFKVKSILDVAVVSGEPDFVLADNYHDGNKKVLSYGNPQIGLENQKIYRINYGLKLWKNKYDGAMCYAYQHSFGNIWNDFDHVRYRDHVFAYPVMNGVVDTIQYESFREGVDDVRYVETLKNYIKCANPYDDRILNANTWITNIDYNSNIDKIRSECIDHILKIRDLCNYDAPVIESIIKQ
jgi:hypothetical protein